MGEKRRNGSVKHDISVPLSSVQRFLDLAEAQVRSHDADLELSVYGYGGDGRIAAMRRIKTAFDPADIMNRGAIVRRLRK